MASQGREVVGPLVLGAWDDYRAFERMVASARDATREEVLAALRRHRDEVAAFLGDGDRDLDVAAAASTAGRLLPR